MVGLLFPFFYADIVFPFKDNNKNDNNNNNNTVYTINLAGFVCAMFYSAGFCRR